MREAIIIGGANPTIIRTIEDINKNGKEEIRIAAIIDNKLAKGTKLLNEEVAGGFEILNRFGIETVFVNTIASNTKTRKEITEFLLSTGRKTINIIHPSVNIEYVDIGEGNIVYEGAIIHPNTSIGSHNILSSMSCIAHDTTIGDYNFIGPNTYICGRTMIGSRNFFGVGTSVAPRIEIEDECLIAACSFVNCDIMSETRVKGIPAKPY